MPGSTLALPDKPGFGWAKARALALVSAGGALEFYDYHLFGLFSSNIAAIFFPAKDRTASLILTFAAFAAGYLARPLGGLVLGHFGDRYGRTRVFTVSLLGISLCTAAFGLVPGYAAWGLWSPLLILVLRCIQGFCLGGEIPMAVTYVVESVTPRRAGLGCGWIYLCINVGVVVSSGLAWAINALLPPAQAFESGWRIAFLLGGVAGLVALWRRRALCETPEYERMRQYAPRRPLAEVIGGHWRTVLIGAAAMALPSAFNALFFTHMTSYLADLGYAAAQVSRAQTVAIVTLSLGMVVSAWLGDRVSRPLVMGAGALLFVALSYPFYGLLISREADPVLLFALAAAAAALANGTFACLVAQMFPTRVRFSGLALAINIGFMVFGGVAPLSAASAIAVTGHMVAPAMILTACGLLTLIAAVAAYWRSRPAGAAVKPFGKGERLVG